MSFSEIILTLIDNRQLAFELEQAPDAVALREDWLEQTVPLEQVSRITLLQSDKQIVLALYPMGNQLNMQKLRTIIGNDLRFIDTNHAVGNFYHQLKAFKSSGDSEPAMQIIIDEALTNQDVVYFEASKPCSLLKLHAEQLGMLADDVLLGTRISEPHASNKSGAKQEQAAIDLRARIAKLTRLPAMPEMPARILALRNNPSGTADDLSAIIETDPSLTAQIMRYANSAMFNHHSPAASIKDAIFRILGYETVLHITLGYALGKAFKLPASGPLGNDSFWQHATFSAALAQQLAHAIPKARRPKPGLAYLSGLLHDVGFLVLHLFFRSEHAWLNKMLQNHPDESIIEMEQRLLGISHNELGGWLFHAWNMPAELICAVTHHHNLDYQGEHAEYALILNLTERLLKTHGISDADTDDIPESLFVRLGLDEEEVYLIVDKVLQGGVTLRDMARAVAG